MPIEEDCLESVSHIEEYNKSSSDQNNKSFDSQSSSSITENLSHSSPVEESCKHNSLNIQVVQSESPRKSQILNRSQDEISESKNKVTVIVGDDVRVNKNNKTSFVSD